MAAEYIERQKYFNEAFDGYADMFADYLHEIYVPLYAALWALPNQHQVIQGQVIQIG